MLVLGKPALIGALVAGILLTLVAPANATLLRKLDYQGPLLAADGFPTQWDNYVPDGSPTSGITVGSPGTLPFPYTQAAKFTPAEPTGRPRSMAKLSKLSTADRGVTLDGPLDAAEGLDRYYRWYTYFPSDYDLTMKPAKAPSIFMAWHADSSKSGCNPNVQMHAKRMTAAADGLRILVRTQGGLYSHRPPKDFEAEGGTPAACYTETFKEIDLGPVVRDRWILWMVHVRWSSDPDEGVVHIVRDDQLTTIPGANLYRAEGTGPKAGTETAFLEQGIYSPVDRTPAARQRSIWHVGMLLADSFADITPARKEMPNLPASVLRPLESSSAPARALPKCRRIATRERRGIRVAEEATVSRRAVVYLSGARRGVRLLSASTGGQRFRVSNDRVRIPVTAFRALGARLIKVRVAGPGGRVRKIELAARVRRCG